MDVGHRDKVQACGQKRSSSVLLGVKCEADNDER